MPDPDATTTAVYADTIAAGMRGLNDHFHAIHDDEDSVEECCVAAVIEAAGFADTFDACQQATADERQRIHPLHDKWHADADDIRSSNTEAGAAARATLRQCAMELADLLDGDGNAR